VSAPGEARRPGAPRPTRRDRRRRSLGQNFLVDSALIERFVSDLDLDEQHDGRHDEQHVVLEIGAGTGALTVPMARRGAEILAVEADPVWADRLRRRLAAEVPDAARVRVVAGDVRHVRLPERPYRVVGNVPFGGTTDLLAHLLDDPARGPVRADLIVQYEVARKHAMTPPTALRTAAWAPWWEFELGARIGRDSFRPRPGVDAAVLVVRKREPAILPPHLAGELREALRPVWGAAVVRRPSRDTRRRRG